MKHQGNPNVQLFSHSISSTMVADFSVEQVSHPLDLAPENAGNIFEPSHEKAKQFGFLTRSNTNRAVQPQKQARSLNLPI